MISHSIGGIHILLKNIDFSKDLPEEGETSQAIATDTDVKSKPILDSIEESEWEFTEDLSAQITSPEKTEESESVEETRISSDTIIEVKNRGESFLQGDYDRPGNLKDEYLEFKSAVFESKLLSQDELEKQNLELTKKQELILSLEKKNTELQDELKSKLKEYEKQSKQMQKETEKLDKRELKLEKKIKEHQQTVQDYETLTKEKESYSSQVGTEWAKLKKAQKEFKAKILSYRKKVREEVTTELAQELVDSRTELEEEWSKLHTEENRLSGVYQDMLKAKDKFKEKLEEQVTEINRSRKGLAKEWEQVKLLRSNLEKEKCKLENCYGNGVDSEHMMEIDKQIKKSLEDQMLSDMENKLRMEITEQLSKEYIDSKEKLENEWKQLRNEQAKLAEIQNELLPDRRVKFKNNFDNRLKKVLRVFKKNKLRKAELEAIEAEFRKEEEHRQQELALEEQRKHELDEFTKTLEEQRKELDLEREEIAEEWKYISKLREKIMEESANEKKTKITATDDEKLVEAGVETNIDNEEDSDITKELENLQVELKKEWNELKQQHERLSNARKEFSKARKAFEEDRELKRKKFDKIPLAHLGLERLFK
jgi:hypothetical protein